MSNKQNPNDYRSILRNDLIEKAAMHAEFYYNQGELIIRPPMSPEEDLRYIGQIAKEIEREQKTIELATATIKQMQDALEQQYNSQGRVQTDGDNNNIKKLRENIDMESRIMEAQSINLQALKNVLDSISTRLTLQGVQVETFLEKFKMINGMPAKEYERQGIKKDLQDMEESLQSVEKDLQDMHKEAAQTTTDIPPTEDKDILQNTLNSGQNTAMIEDNAQSSMVSTQPKDLIGPVTEINVEDVKSSTTGLKAGSTPDQERSGGAEIHAL